MKQPFTISHTNTDTHNTSSLRPLKNNSVGIKKAILFPIFFFISTCIFAQPWTDVFTFYENGSTTKTKTFKLWLPNGASGVSGLLITDGVVDDYKVASDIIIRAACTNANIGVLQITGSYYGTFGDEWKGPLLTTDKLGAGYTNFEHEFLSCLDSLARRTGHAELNYVPFLSFGHSTSAIFARNIAWWNPERALGVIIYKSGKFLKPTWASLTADLKNVPVLFFPGEYEQASPNHVSCVTNKGAESMEVQWQGNRDSAVYWNSRGYLLNVVAQPMDPNLGLKPADCYTTNNTWWVCGVSNTACNMHTIWVGTAYRGLEALNLLSSFIIKASNARIPNKSIPFSGFTTLNPIDKTKGVFATSTEIRTSFIDANLSNSPKLFYHYNEHPGNPDSNFYFMDDDFALDWLYYMNNAGAYNGSNNGYIPVVSNPVFQLTSATTMAITSPTEGSEIYYSTTGVPSKSSNLYTGEINIDTTASITINTIAYKTDSKYGFDWRSSDIKSITITKGAVAVEPNTKDKTLTISPNPCEDLLIVKSDKSLLGTIYIYSQMGKVIKTIQNTKDVKEINIHVNDLSSGVYVINIGTSREIFVKK